MIIDINAIGAVTGVLWFIALFMALSMRSKNADPTLVSSNQLHL
ncbi:hypothetical protein [Streptomyces sp. NPDC059639]